MSSTPRNILIVLLGAIGDVARALPLAVRIQRAWPDARLSWAVEPPSLTLVEGHPAVDEVLLFDRKRGFFEYIRFLKTLRIKRYDLVLDLQRHLKSGVTSFATGAGRRVGFHRKNSREFNWLFNNEHIVPLEHFSPKVSQFQQFGDQLKIPLLEPFTFGLAASDEERARMEEFLVGGREDQTSPFPPVERRIALILGSTWPSRFWLPERYCEVIREAHAHWGFGFVLVGGKSERVFADRIRAQVCASQDFSVKAPLVDLVEKTSLRELVALFSCVRVAVGSDSGPMHIASAVGIPVISLWGSTSPRRSAPFGSESLVLQSAIGCSPCYRSKCPGLDTLCMREIRQRRSWPVFPGSWKSVVPVSTSRPQTAERLTEKPK